MLTFKKHTAANGLPGFRVLAGAAVLGTIFNPGPPGDPWQGTTPDGTRFGASSKTKIAAKLQEHARAKREAARA
jgi:hypothetical protein